MKQPGPLMTGLFACVDMFEFAVFRAHLAFAVCPSWFVRKSVDFAGKHKFKLSTLFVFALCRYLAA